MKKTFAFVIFLLLSVSGGAADGKFPKPGGPFLGQTPPGLEPQVFAPGIVSTELNTRDIAITPDGREIYFCVNAAGFTFSTILVTRQRDGAWPPSRGSTTPRSTGSTPVLSTPCGRKNSAT